MGQPRVYDALGGSVNRPDLIAKIRSAANELGFESPLRGAVLLQRLQHDLPVSESFKGLSTLERARESIRRTIEHHHAANDLIEPNGHDVVVFGRHVIEGDRRWDFEVDVRITLDGIATIDDVRIVRPGEDGDSPRPTTGLSPEDLLPFGMLGCPCCGHATLTERGGYNICPVCFWEDDGSDDASVEILSGPNHITLREGRINVLRIGACDERAREHVRSATAEEVRLRRFGPDGNEVPMAPPTAGHSNSH